MSMIDLPAKFWDKGPNFLATARRRSRIEGWMKERPAAKVHSLQRNVLGEDCVLTHTYIAIPAEHFNKRQFGF